jgi:hypothetical protein
MKQIDPWQKTAGCYFNPASPRGWAALSGGLSMMLA